MSHPKVIRSHVPMSLARLIRRLQIASEAGVAKTIWATLAIKGYLAEFALRQSSTSHDQPSATVIDSFIHTFNAIIASSADSSSSKSGSRGLSRSPLQTCARGGDTNAAALRARLPSS